MCFPWAGLLPSQTAQETCRSRSALLPQEPLHPSSPELLLLEWLLAGPLGRRAPDPGRRQVMLSVMNQEGNTHAYR